MAQHCLLGRIVIGKGFIAQYVDAGLHERAGRIIMHMVRGGNHHRVNAVGPRSHSLGSGNAAAADDADSKSSR